MSVIRVHKNKNFTVMSNTHLFDKNLSLKASGLLSKILALPDNWNYSIKGLCAICKENETAVKNALNELRDNRYVIVERIEPSKETGGRIQYEYFVYEQPQGEDNKKVDVKEAYKSKQEQEKQPIEKQGVENLGVEILSVENMGCLLNTNIPSTNKINTDTVNTDGLSTDNNSLSNDKDNSKTKVLETYNSPVSEETKQETSVSKTLGRKTHTPKQTPLKDMPTRAREIAVKLVDDVETIHKVSECIGYFLEQYKTHRHKEHIYLTNDKLHDIVVTMLSTITIQHENDSRMFKSDYNPLVADNVSMDDIRSVIDGYFNTNFREKTDYSLVHFTQYNVLTNVMNKCTLDGNPWHESHSL